MPLLFHMLKLEDKIKLSDLYAKLGGIPLSLPWEPEDFKHFADSESAIFIHLKLEDPEEIGKLIAKRPHYVGRLG
jgi:hypothetical protein